MTGPRTIRDAVALALEAVAFGDEWVWQKDERTALRDHVIAWVRDYAAHRGVILSDTDIVGEFNEIVRELRGLAPRTSTAARCPHEWSVDEIGTRRCIGCGEWKP